MSDQSRPGLAALWMIGAIISFTAMAVAGREAGLTLDTFEIMTYRSILGPGDRGRGYRDDGVVCI